MAFDHRLLLEKRRDWMVRVRVKKTKIIEFQRLSIQFSAIPH